MNCTPNAAGYIVLADCTPLALVAPHGGGDAVLGFAASDDTATLFPTLDEAEAAITRPPDHRRMCIRIITLTPSNVIHQPAPEPTENLDALLADAGVGGGQRRTLADGSNNE